MKTSECATRKHFQFGSFSLDASSRTLLESGRRVPLPAKAFDTLVALVENRGEVLDKKMLMDLVWPETAVEENNLAQSIGSLRKALGEQSGDPHYILTVPGQGYCFVADVTEAPPEPTPLPVRRAGRPVWLTLAGAVALTVIGWVWLGRAPDQTRLTPLTGSGGESIPSFSPDGGRVAYWWQTGDQATSGIYVKVIGAGDPLPLVVGKGASEPAWSPDGRYIAYFRVPAGIYVTPALGGAERLLTSVNESYDAAPRMGWSPDAGRLAIFDRDPETGFRSIFEIAVDTGERRRLTTGTSTWGDRAPAYSPDGKTLAFIRHRGSAGTAIFLMPAAGGEPRQLTGFEESAGAFDWTPDGREIVYAAALNGFNALWRIPVSGGARRQVIAAGYDAGTPAIARAGNRLAFIRAVSTVNLWRVDLDRPEPPRPLARTTRRQTSPQFSPDGKKLAFASNRSGGTEIWISDGDGSRLMQVTSMGDLGRWATPRWSPDGLEIAFGAAAGGNADVYAVSAQGGAPRRLTSETAEDVLPSFSRDGRWIYFASDRSGAFQIWKVRRGGGDAIQVTTQGGADGLESADGKYIYYINYRHSNEVWRMPVAGGVEERVFSGGSNWKNHVWRWQAGWWTVAPDGILYIERKPARGWLLNRFDPESATARTVAEMRQPPVQIPCLTVSPDGKSVVYAQVGTPPSTILLLENFR